MKQILPYDRTNPVVYDNDSHSDVYTDEFLLALSSAGKIDLRGFITTSPESCCVNGETYAYDAAGREGIVEMARESGMERIPKVLRGPAVSLVEPASGRIEDTAALDSPGSRLIVDEARRATPQKPLVLVMGGPLTAAADAYLLCPEIADRLVVSWIGGRFTDMDDYNGVMDRWAAYIVATRLRMVMFPVALGGADTPHERFLPLPKCPLRTYMLEKRLPHVNRMPRAVERDDDGNPAVSLLGEEFILDSKRVSFERWGPCAQGLMPQFRDEPEGNIRLVTRIDRGVLNGMWWDAMNDPAAWHPEKARPVRELRPFYAAPFPIGEVFRVEAEDFNNGGEGKAFHSGAKETFPRIYRPEPVCVEPAYDSLGGYNMGLEGGYCLSGLAAGDWFAYTLRVARAGEYLLHVRAASEGDGGSLHMEFGEESTETLKIPDTVRPYRWTTLTAGAVFLREGEQIARLCIDAPGARGQVGRINYFQLLPYSRKPRA